MGNTTWLNYSLIMFHVNHVIREAQTVIQYAES